MTDNKAHFLSDYQRAMLTEMGVLPLALRDDAITQQTKTAIHVKPVSDELEQEQELKSNPDELNNQPVSQPEISSQSSPILKSEPTSLNGKVLLGMTEKQFSQPLVQDVLIALDIQPTDCVVIESPDCTQYCDYGLSWLISSKIEFFDNRLVTKPLSEMDSAQNKKALWSAITSA